MTFEHKITVMDEVSYVNVYPYELNKMSEDGWELVSVCSNNYGIRLFWKRPIKELI
jgi:hypothetical protein